MTNQIIHYVDGHCGSGKTREFCKAISQGDVVNDKRIVIAAVTIDLINEISNYLNFLQVPHKKIHSGNGHNASGRYRAAIDNPINKVIIATHVTVLSADYDNVNLSKFALFIDEAPQIETEIKLPFKDNIDEIGTNFIFTPFSTDADFITMQRNADSDTYTKVLNHGGDVMYEPLYELFAAVDNPYCDVVITRAMYDKIFVGKRSSMQFIASNFTRPDIFSKWAEVTILAANFVNKSIFKIWQKYGVAMQPHPHFAVASSHPEQAGNRVKIGYFFDKPAARNDLAGYKQVGIDFYAEMGQAVEREFGGDRYLATFNNSVDTSDKQAFINSKDIGVVAHGLSAYRHFTKAFFGAFVNNTPSHIKLVNEVFGITGTDLYESNGFDVAYQFLCRTHVREKKVTEDCHFIVLDKRTADLLIGKFPGASTYQVSHNIALPAKTETKVKAEDKDRQAKTREIDKIEKPLLKQIKPTKNVHFGFGQGRSDTKPVAMTESVKGFFRWLDSKRNRLPASKHQSPYLTPSVTRSDETRQNPNILAIDIDATTIDPQDALDAIGYTAGIYNTYSCDVGATGVYRYRIFVPMTHSVPGDFAKWVIRNIASKLAAIDTTIDIDKMSAKDIFYLPCRPLSGQKVDYFRHVDTSKPVLDPRTLTRRWAKAEYKALQAQPITAPFITALPAPSNLKPWQQAIRRQKHKEVIQAGLANFGSGAPGTGNKRFNAFAHYLAATSDIDITELSTYLQATYQFFGSDMADRKRQATALLTDHHIQQIISKRGF